MELTLQALASPKGARDRSYGRRDVLSTDISVASVKKKETGWEPVALACSVPPTWKDEAGSQGGKADMKRALRKTWECEKPRKVPHLLWGIREGDTKPEVMSFPGNPEAGGAFKSRM